VNGTRLSWIAIAAAAQIAAAVPGPSQARAATLFASGEQAGALCANSNDWCVGFVTGALDGWAALEAYYNGEKFCLPDDLTSGQIVEIFALQLREHPDRNREPAAYLLYEKMIESSRACASSRVRLAETRDSQPRWLGACDPRDQGD
jgi:hypothetical protein